MACQSSIRMQLYPYAKAFQSASVRLQGNEAIMETMFGRRCGSEILQIAVRSSVEKISSCAGPIPVESR